MHAPWFRKCEKGEVEPKAIANRHGTNQAGTYDDQIESCMVLIVEDDLSQAQLLRTVLENGGYPAVLASTGEEGLRVADAISPDLVLLDVMLPDMDGYEICRRIRANETLSETYIIMLTSLSDRDSRIKGFEAGADDLITKPYDSLELNARVRTIARLNRYRRLVEERDRNALLLSELQSAYNATLYSWSRALDLRDHDTEGHTQRVSELTMQLAEHLGVDEKKRVHLYRGALLHDIGKIGVPDRILHKSGPLTEDEWELMRCHPKCAYDMLLHIDFLRPALEIPYCHHEWWDGSGYPRGLKGEEIPLSARIFSVVDVWDATVSERPYRRPMPQEAALKYICQHAGTHFDPAIAKAFEDLVQRPEVQSLYSSSE